MRLLTNRFFARGTVAVFLVAIGLFGGMGLLPLYYQTVRGKGALNAGLLFAPQGLGAIVAMVIAGRLTDRIGAGYVVPVGVVIALIGTYPFTQIDIDTSYAWLGVTLFVRGMGLGSVMMPTIASVYTKLSSDKVSRAAPPSQPSSRSAPPWAAPCWSPHSHKDSPTSSPHTASRSPAAGPTRSARCRPTRCYSSRS